MKAQRLTSKHQYVALNKGINKNNKEIFILLIIYNIIGLDSSIFTIFLDRIYLRIV